MKSDPCLAGCGSRQLITRYHRILGITLLLSMPGISPAEAQELSSFKTDKSVQYMGWVDGGKALATTEKNAKSIKLYDPASGLELGEYTFENSNVACMAVSADGRVLAAASADFRNVI